MSTESKMTYEEYRKLVHDLCYENYLSGYPREKVEKWLASDEQEQGIRDSYEHNTDPKFYVPHAMKTSRTKEDAANRILNYKNGSYLRSAAGECAYAFGMMYE